MYELSTEVHLHAGGAGGPRLLPVPGQGHQHGAHFTSCHTQTCLTGKDTLWCSMHQCNVSGFCILKIIKSSVLMVGFCAACQVRVLYKRKDRGFGVIVPQLEDN